MNQEISIRSRLTNASAMSLNRASTHGFRHASGTRSASQSAPLDVIQNRPGHASMPTAASLHELNPFIKSHRDSPKLLAKPTHSKRPSIYSKAYLLCGCEQLRITPTLLPTPMLQHINSGHQNLVTSPRRFVLPSTSSSASHR